MTEVNIYDRVFVACHNAGHAVACLELGLSFSAVTMSRCTSKVVGGLFKTDVSTARGWKWSVAVCSGPFAEVRCYNLIPDPNDPYQDAYEEFCAVADGATFMELREGHEEIDLAWSPHRSTSDTLINAGEIMKERWRDVTTLAIALQSSPDGLTWQQCCDIVGTTRGMPLTSEPIGNAPLLV
jgi:hypothetical protein